MSRGPKKSEIFIGGTIVFAIFLLGIFLGYERIEPGNAGIKVKLVGENRGVQDVTEVSGRVFYNKIKYDVIEFPTFLQTVNWTKNPNEGSPVDESITFNSIEGSSLNVDVSVSYSFIPEDIPALYVKFRKSPEQIMDVDIRSRVRDAFSRHASTMAVMDIFGEKKQTLLEEVKDDLNQSLKAEGILFEVVSFIGKPRLDPSVEAQINSVIAASQKAKEEENRIVEKEALAKQNVADSEGESKSILNLAEARAEANRKISESLTPELIQYLAIEKWDGRLPSATGDGAIPFLQLPSDENSIVPAKNDGANGSALTRAVNNHRADR